MSAIFEAARRDIDAIISHLRCVEVERRLVERVTQGSSDADIEAYGGRLAELNAQSPTRRLIVYSAAVLALYGAYERFIEEVLESYASGFPSRVPHYADISEAVRLHHLRLSLELASRDGARSKLAVPQIILNLAGCIGPGGSDGYTLNAEAFRVHYGNIRAGKLGELFAAVGFERLAEKVVRIPPLAHWVMKEVQAERLIKSEAAKLAYLDDFVERRNEVAHGEPSEVLSLDLIEAYAAFLKSLCESLSALVVAQEYQDLTGRLVCLGKPIRVFKKIRVVTFDLKNVVLRPGTRLLVCRGQGVHPKFVEQAVSSIQVRGKDRRSVTARTRVIPAGIKLGDVPTEGIYYVLA